MIETAGESFSLKTVSKDYLMYKRVLDVILSVLGLLGTSVIMLLVAIAIKLEDPKGPIFFSQNRCGINGKIFKIYKFRSM